MPGERRTSLSEGLEGCVLTVARRLTGTVVTEPAGVAGLGVREARDLFVASGHFDFNAFEGFRAHLPN